jgi:hypothetical protein
MPVLRPFHQLGQEDGRRPGAKILSSPLDARQASNGAETSGG